LRFSPFGAPFSSSRDIECESSDVQIQQADSSSGNILGTPDADRLLLSIPQLDVDIARILIENVPEHHAAALYDALYNHVSGKAATDVTINVSFYIMSRQNANGYPENRICVVSIFLGFSLLRL
jgi:hypothetical protein